MSDQLEAAVLDGDLDRVASLARTASYEARVWALHLAAQEGETDIATHLVRIGVPVDALDGNAATPLLRAFSSNHASTASMLLDLGARASAASTDGFTALHYTGWVHISLVVFWPTTCPSGPGERTNIFNSPCSSFFC